MECEELGMKTRSSGSAPTIEAIRTRVSLIRPFRINFFHLSGDASDWRERTLHASSTGRGTAPSDPANDITIRHCPSIIVVVMEYTNLRSN